MLSISFGLTNTHTVASLLNSNFGNTILFRKYKCIVAKRVLFHSAVVSKRLKQRSLLDEWAQLAPSVTTRYSKQDHIYLPKYSAFNNLNATVTFENGKQGKKSLAHTY